MRLALCGRAYVGAAREFAVMVVAVKVVAG